MGMGLASLFSLVFLVGLLMNFWLVRSLFSWIERRIRKIPLVKTVYSATHDIREPRIIAILPSLFVTPPSSLFIIPKAPGLMNSCFGCVP